METPRYLAYSVLSKCLFEQQYSNIALNTALQRSNLSISDKQLATALTYGVLERKITLEYQITLISSRTDIDHDVLVLCMLGIYQLAFMDKIPDHAAVDEIVKLAPSKKRGFINAILRTFIRNGKQIQYPTQTNILDYLCVRYSICRELCEKLTSVFGIERSKSLLEGFEKKVQLSLRVNTLKTSTDDLLSQLTSHSYTASISQIINTCIHVSNGDIVSMPGFSEGLFFIQDIASQICVNKVQAKPGMIVVDTCSCPGSKSFGIALDMQNKGAIYSYDLHKSKLSLVSQSAERLGINIIQTEERDARTPNATLFHQCDRVLCDVPCSGFGVLSKKPEIRYKNPLESSSLPDIQLAILNASKNYLKDDGKLIYSTCTILPEENENNIQRFLQNNADFYVSYQKTFYPDIDHTDGFFIAVLERK